MVCSLDLDSKFDVGISILVLTCTWNSDLGFWLRCSYVCKHYSDSLNFMLGMCCYAGFEFDFDSDVIVCFRLESVSGSDFDLGL